MIRCFMSVSQELLPTIVDLLFCGNYCYSLCRYIFFLSCVLLPCFVFQLVKKFVDLYNGNVLVEVLTLEWFGYVWFCFLNSKAMKHLKKRSKNLQSTDVYHKVDCYL